MKTFTEKYFRRAVVLLILGLLPAWAGTIQAVDETPTGVPSSELELQGAEAYFHFAMAKLAQRQQRYDAAVAFLRQAAEADPGSASIQAELASTFMIVRDYPAAEKAAQRALELEPENAPAHTVLAHLYYSRARRGIDPEANRQRAMEALQASLSGNDEDDPDVLLTLGRFYFEEGDYSRAAETLQRYVDSQPGSPTNSLFLLARAQIQIEDYDGAEQSLELVLASVPDSLQALETLIYFKRLRGVHAGSLVRSWVHDPAMAKIKALYPIEFHGPSAELNDGENRRTVPRAIGSPRLVFTVPSVFSSSTCIAPRSKPRIPS